MTVIGIDLGTTNSLAVAYSEGQVRMIPNSFGEYLTPSVVYYDGSEIQVGKIAREKLVTHPQDTAQLFKLHMGANRQITLSKRAFQPEELSACVLKQLVADAEAFLGQKVTELVISVPAYFNAEQRQATKKAGELLGLKVERLINEPSAAAIACHQADEFETFVVFDFGGGTLDVSVVDCFENVISIAAIAGDNHLGGSDFDRLIAQYVCRKAGTNFEALNRRTRNSLLLAAERVKKQLSEFESVNMQVQLEGKSHEYKITNELLAEISQPLFKRMREVIRKAIVESKFGAGELDRLILVGGSSYMPVVNDYLKRLLNLPVVSGQKMDELVALGLGQYIGIKTRAQEVKDLVVTDICPFSLSTSVHNYVDEDKDLSDVLIARNSVLPSSKTQIYSPVRKDQPTIRFKVYQGEAMYAKDNLFLGSVQLPVPSNVDDQSFAVTYSYDINSILYVEIKTVATDEVKTYKLGPNKSLVAVDATDTAHKEIKELALQLASQPERDALFERALRLYQELSLDQQQALQLTLMRFSRLFSRYQNNLLKKRQLLDSTNDYLDHLEWGLDAGMGDIFRDVESDWDQDSDWDQELEAELDRTVMEFLNEDSETEEGEDAHG